VLQLLQFVACYSQWLVTACSSTCNSCVHSVSQRNVAAGGNTCVEAKRERRGSVKSSVVIYYLVSDFEFRFLSAF